jgi:hypothetical protein
MSIKKYIYEAKHTEFLQTKLNLNSDEISIVEKIFSEKYHRLGGKLMVAVNSSPQKPSINTTIEEFKKVVKIIDMVKQNPRLPLMDLDRLPDYFKSGMKTFGQFQGMDFNLDHVLHAYDFTNIYLANFPQRNMQNTPMEEAVLEVSEWIRGGQGEFSIPTEEGQTVIHRFDDGYYWLDLNSNVCVKTGASMSHCEGDTRAETLLSLRDANHVPHVTIAYNRDGTYTQAKGKGNKKPIEKYFPYIIELFENGDDWDYPIGEYLGNNPYSDFTTADIDGNLSELNEAMTQQQRQYFRNIQMDIIEEVEVGEYDVVLFHSPMYERIIGTGYNVGFQRQGRDFTSHTDQTTSQPIDSMSIPNLLEVLKVVIEWTKKYGQLSVGSYNERNNRIYQKVFRRYNVPYEERSEFGQDFVVIG